MNQSINLYEVLGFSSDISNTSTITIIDIKQAYHRLILQYHPDKCHDCELSKAKFLQIQYAWEILNDQNRRQEYDLQLQNKLLSTGIISHELVDMSEFTFDNIQSCYSKQCRCGDIYEIHKDDIQDIELDNEMEDDCISIQCNGCSLYISLQIKDILKMK